MSADALARAATKMRERALAATPSADPQPGGWAGYSRPDDLGDAAIFGGPSVNGYRDSTVLRFCEYVDCEECARPSDADVEHIASWHPAVALAIADWLDSIKREHYDVDCGPECTTRTQPAVDVARAYLGETS